MVVDEKPKKRGILEGIALIIKLSSQFVHRASRAKDVFESVVHRIVEGGVKSAALIASHVVCVAIENLSYREHSSSSAVLFPKVSLYFWRSVYSEAVEVESVNGIFDPLDQCLANKLVILVEVRKVS